MGPPAMGRPRVGLHPVASWSPISVRPLAIAAARTVGAHRSVWTSHPHRRGARFHAPTAGIVRSAVNPAADHASTNAPRSHRSVAHSVTAARSSGRWWSRRQLGRLEEPATPIVERRSVPAADPLAQPSTVVNVPQMAGEIPALRVPPPSVTSQITPGDGRHSKRQPLWTFQSGRGRHGQRGHVTGVSFAIVTPTGRSTEARGDHDRRPPDGGGATATGPAPGASGHRRPFRRPSHRGCAEPHRG